MKRLIGKVLILVILTAWLACSNQARENNDISLPYYCQVDFTPEWIPNDSSFYDSIHVISDFSFKNQHGETVNLETFKDRIIVANFFFTICHGICPKMMGNMHLLQDDFGIDDGVVFLSHSVTPWIDTVGKLKEYAMDNDITSTNWHLLTGDKTEIYKIARLSYFADEGFGKSVTKIDDFLHTENIVLVDKQKRIRGVYSGTLPLEVKRLIEDINLLKLE